MVKKNSNSKNMDIPSWNLSDLYSGIDDPKIKGDRGDVLKLSDGLIKKYKGRVKNLSPKELLTAIKAFESMSEKFYVYLEYAFYLHALDTESEKIGAFYQESTEFATKVSSSLLWFSLEFQSLPKEKASKLIKSPILKEYRHYLTQMRVFSPFRKSLPEEEIMVKMDQTGSEAFVRFYDEKSSSETFEYKGKSLTSSEIAAILKDDPKVENRKLAAKAYTKNYKDNQRFYTFVLNNLLLDKKITDEIRGYKYPQEATFLGYEIKPKVVKSLVSTVEKNYSLSERFYQAKSKFLGRKLFEWDRYSSIYFNKKREIPWSEAKEIILKSFGDFDPEFGKIANLFFENGWIDAKVRKGKRSGAFCSYCVPSRHPYVLTNYTGGIEDVMTLGHELGHAIHAYLARGNSLSNFDPSTATAEIASVFAESLVFDYLYKNIKNKKDRINLLTNRIQEGFATIFRQIAFYQFETKIHEARREKGELSGENFNKLYQDELKKMFGKGLTLTDDHKYWWMPVIHFFHFNFYVFTYAFGEALTLALYQSYKENGQKFVKNYKKALSAGGSISPKEVVKIMGVNIEDPNFWQEGINLMENYVKEFENLVSSTNKKS